MQQKIYGMYLPEAQQVYTQDPDTGKITQGYYRQRVDETPYTKYYLDEVINSLVNDTLGEDATKAKYEPTEGIVSAAALKRYTDAESDPSKQARIGAGVRGASGEALGGRFGRILTEENIRDIQATLIYCLLQNYMPPSRSRRIEKIRRRRCAERSYREPFPPMDRANSPSSLPIFSESVRRNQHHLLPLPVTMVQECSEADALL